MFALFSLCFFGSGVYVGVLLSLSFFPRHQFLAFLGICFLLRSNACARSVLCCSSAWEEVFSGVLLGVCGCG